MRKCCVFQQISGAVAGFNAVAEQLGKNCDGKVWKTSPFSLRRSMGWYFCSSRVFHFTSAVTLRRADSPGDPGKGMGMLLLTQDIPPWGCGMPVLCGIATTPTDLGSHPGI